MRSFLMPYGTVGRIKRSGNHCETWAVRPDVLRNSRHPTGGYPRGSRPQTARFPANRVQLNFPRSGSEFVDGAKPIQDLPNDVIHTFVCADIGLPKEFCCMTVW